MSVFLHVSSMCISTIASWQLLASLHISYIWLIEYIPVVHLVVYLRMCCWWWLLFVNTGVLSCSTIGQWQWRGLCQSAVCLYSSTHSTRGELLSRLVHITHWHFIVRELKGWRWKSVEKPELRPLPSENAWTDGHQNWQWWLCTGYVPRCKISLLVITVTQSNDIAM